MSKRSHYRLLGLVGQGQFGQVFCAASRQTGRLVALKRLDHQRFPTHKFLRELRFLLSLRHPNIVACQALEHTETGRYLVMDYCEAGTLRNLMMEDSRLSLPQSLKLVADILTGLAHAHSRGIVHCDVKPENILLTLHATGWTARVSDFGIARLTQELESQEMGNTGSPAYMAPERFYGEYSQTSDLYSVGVLLFELLTGDRPFSGTPAELMLAHLNRPVQMPDSIAEPWRSIIGKALQKLSARRFRSAEEMLSALRQAAVTDPSNNWLERSSIPLLRSISIPFDCLFQVKAEFSLPHLITAFAMEDHSLYLGSIDRVLYQADSPSLLAIAVGEVHASHQQSSLALAAPVESLVLRPQGCFVLTKRSVHLVSCRPELRYPPQAILSLAQDSKVAIDPQGDWLAALSLASKAPALSFLRVSSRPLNLATAPVELSIKGPQFQISQLLIPDRRHVIIAIDLSYGAPGQSGAKQEYGTLLKLLTRRGREIGSLFLPIRLGPVIPTLRTYQLLAIDRDNPQLAVIVDLKPYRLMRLAIGITADFLAVTPWGYIFADSAGAIVLLDLGGRPVGQLKVPEPITAIAAFEQYGLLIATWQTDQSRLYTIDLREIGMDLVF